MCGPGDGLVHRFDRSIGTPRVGYDHRSIASSSVALDSPASIRKHPPPMSDLDATFVPARLVLEDGTVFHGRAFGRVTPGRSGGEVVFNTAMCGYQEAITDPSYAGQILVLTAPMAGNYGVAPDDMESARPQIAALVVRELSRVRSNQRASRGLAEWLEGAATPAIEGIDTRALVRRLRTAGAMRGVLSVDESVADGELVAAARGLPSMAGRDLASALSPKAPGLWTETLGEWSTRAADPGGVLRVWALDCGAKRNIYRHLADLGCQVEFVPYDTSAETILAAKPDGLMVSNGPGDPAAVAATVETLRRVAGTIPTFGICLGHQLLALALGATTYKLLYGHRGANQPVRNLLTGRVEITSQNHGFCVDAESLAGVGAQATHVHLNDGTLAGFRHLEKPLFCVQYHPEASPGPHDSAYLFDCFVEMMRTGRPIDAETMRAAQDRRAGLIPA